MSKTKIRKTTLKSPADSEAGRTNVLLEAMQSQIAMVADGLIGLRAEMTRQNNDLRTELKLEINALKVAVQINSEDIRKMTRAIEKNSEDIEKNSEDIEKNSEDIKKNSEDIKKNSEDIRKNSEDIQRLCKEVSHLNGLLGVEQPETVIHNLQRRMHVVEQKLGIVG